MPEAICEGRKVRYDVAGSGEPALLLLHGWCDNRTQYHRLLPLLAQKRRVLAVDLPGHGGSESPPGDFGYRELVAGAVAVVEESGAPRVVPVAMAHAGWVALGLRRRLGPERIVKLVFLDWLVIEPARPFLEALQSLQDADRWKSTRAKLFADWLEDAEPFISQHVNRTMGDFSFGMWARAGREVAAAYAREGSPLDALSALDPPTPALHLYALPKEEEFQAAQERFSKKHPWFASKRLDGKTHFPPLETPEAVAAAIEDFVSA